MASQGVPMTSPATRDAGERGSGASRPVPALKPAPASAWRELGFVAAVIALASTISPVIRFAIGSANGWDDLTTATFVDGVAQEFVRYFGSAVVMLAVIEPVRRKGPDAGLPRIAAVTGAVIAAALVATAARTLLWLVGKDPKESEPWSSCFLSVFARNFALAAMLTAVSEFYRSEVRSLEAMRAAEADRAALEQQTLQARLKTLEAQIAPHFLFNTLANVRRLYATDIDAGEAMLDRLMRYLRSALPSMRDEHSTLEREGQLIRAYLELQQVRMGRRLAFDIDIAPALQSAPVPPMMLLTLVENAIKHGLAPLREGGRVEVAARREGGHLRLEVADTGRGFGGDTAGGGTGLANIRARLAAMFGTAAEFTLAAREPRGLVATIRLPAGASGGRV